MGVITIRNAPKLPGQCCAKFSLTPRRIPVERKASAHKSGVDLDMVAEGS